MTNSDVYLVGMSGEPIGKLRLRVLEIVAEAENLARVQNLAKRAALPSFLNQYLNDEGYQVTSDDLKRAIVDFNRVCGGENLPNIQIACALKSLPSDDRKISSNSSPIKPLTAMKQNQPPSQMQKFFEVERVYPDDTSQELYDQLIGLEEHKQRLLVELEMLIYPEQLEVWSRKYHQGEVLQLCKQLRNRVPLILLEGDVGTGKTALAETVGDALARKMGGKSKVHLLKINSQVRGTGLVGEMSDLIVQAFAQAEARAASLKGEPVLLLLDEADALAARRDTQQMHHEDKAGLNTLLQRLDNLRLGGLAIAVIFITNRPDALDPAIRRRAALDLLFERPGDNIRAEIIRNYLPELNLTGNQIDQLIYLTGSQVSKNENISFTASDMTNRLFMGALREAFSQKRELKFEDLLEQAKILVSTPRMGRI
jgi:AAA+ superfamily predicted ATPase